MTANWQSDSGATPASVAPTTGLQLILRPPAPGLGFEAAAAAAAGGVSTPPLNSAINCAPHLLTVASAPSDFDLVHALEVLLPRPVVEFPRTGVRFSCTLCIPSLPLDSLGVASTGLVARGLRILCCH